VGVISRGSYSRVHVSVSVSDHWSHFSLGRRKSPSLITHFDHALSACSCINIQRTLFTQFSVRFRVAVTWRVLCRQ